MTPQAGMRVIGYARVSTASQEDGASLDEQENAIRAHCDSKGLILVDLYRETGSGKSMRKRPLFTEALRRMEDKSDADRPEAIVAAYLDRLTRSAIDAGYIFERQRKHGWQIIALDLGIDTTTAAGELVAGVMIQIAQWQRRYISERTKSGLAERRRQGVRLGRPRTMPDVTMSHIVSLRSAGKSYAAIADTLNADGLRSSMGPAREDEKRPTWVKQSVAQAIQRNGGGK